MKRFKLYFVLVLAVLLSAALAYWHYFSYNSKNRSLEGTLTKNIFLSETNIQPSFEQKQQSSNNEAHSSSTSQSFQKLIDMARSQSETALAGRSKPIAFYGKVVDETTQAVANANIHFVWVDPVSTSETNMISSLDGSFSLTDVLGGTVNVDVWKDGYYEAKSTKGYNYDNSGNGSSIYNPVIFYLRKKGTGRDLISAALDVKFSRDGTPMSVDFINRTFGSSGQMQMSQIKPPYESWKKATAWSFQMVIPDDGFVEESDEFPFEAPVNGYKSTLEFNFKAGQPDWETNLKKSCYIVFGNPPRYGHLDIETDIMWGGARINYAINPDGSQNLEPK